MRKSVVVNMSGETNTKWHILHVNNSYCTPTEDGGVFIFGAVFENFDVETNCGFEMK